MVWFCIAIILLLVVVLELTGVLDVHRLMNPKYYRGMDYRYTDLSLSDQQRVQMGKRRAAESRVVIVGLARDICPHLRQVVPRLEYLGSKFSDYRIIIFENDSDDCSRAFLATCARMNKRIELVECPEERNCRLGELPAVTHGSLSNDRINRMTRYRNRIMDHVYTRHPSFDYMLVIDVDIDSVCPSGGVFHSLSYLRGDTSAIFSNGRMSIPGSLGTSLMAYDSLAFVGANDRVSSSTRTYADIAKDTIRMNKAIHESPTDLVPVKSAFNGAALYRMDMVRGYRYSNVMQCEHIGLHLSMPGQKFINRQWLWYVGNRIDRLSLVLKGEN